MLCVTLCFVAISDHGFVSSNHKRSLSLLGVISNCTGVSSVYRMMMMMIGQDYISELQPPVGFLFIPQMIYEHQEP
jgi:hypothetical protein